MHPVWDTALVKSVNLDKYLDLEAMHIKLLYENQKMKFRRLKKLLLDFKFLLLLQRAVSTVLSGTNELLGLRNIFC